MGKILATPKIFESTDDQIIKTLAQVYIMVGLRPEHLPTKEIDNFNVGFIKRNFASRPLKEITIAFELAVLGQLEIEDAKCYDQFTMEYFCRIMNAYRIYFNRNPPKIEIQPEISNKIENMISPTQKKSEVEEWLKTPLKSITLIPEYIYSYFDELGYVKLTKEEKFYYMDKAAHNQLDKLNNLANDLYSIKAAARWKNTLSEGVNSFTGSDMNLIKSTAKKMIIYDIIKNHQNNEKQTD